MAPSRGLYTVADENRLILRNVRTKSQSLPRVLAKRTAYLEALIEKSPLAIVVLDSNHAVQMCNPAFEGLFLYSEAELIGTNLDDLITTKAMRSGATKITRRVLAGHEVRSTTVRRRKDGLLLNVEIFGVPLFVNGELNGVYGLYQDITETRRLERELRRLSGCLLRSRDEERRRIARELHDSTAQSLSALCMALSRLQMLSDNSTARRKRTSDCLKLAEHCAKEIRTISYLLHPPLLDEVGLASALDWYIDGFSNRSGIQVDMRLPQSLGRLAHDVEITIFRIVQESLTNVLRHSGSPKAEVCIDIVGSELVLKIIDHGKGLSPRRSRSAPKSRFGVGIAGMRERLNYLGGKLLLSSGTGGTTVNAILPLTRAPYE